MGLTRRDFLKLASVMGASLVISSYAGDIKKVFAQAKGKVHLIWLPLGGDTGCSISMLQAYNPDLISSVADLGLSLDFWQAYMTPNYDLGWGTAGYVTEDSSQVPLFNAAFGDAPVDVLIVEGTPLVGTPKGGTIGGFITIGERNGVPVTGYELLQRLAAKATYVVAVGQCSSFGGIPAGKGNVTGAASVTDALEAAGVTTKSPVVNMPGCPANPDWTLLALANAVQGFPIEVDSLGRPTAFYSQTIHDHCPRRGAYDKGQFATAFDDPVNCLWKLGCKGPITNGACSETHWNSGTGTCTLAGPMCWGCMHPNFPDAPASPFFTEVDLVPSFFGLSASDIALGVGVGTAVVLGAHMLRKGLSRPERDEEEPVGQTEVKSK